MRVDGLADGKLVGGDDPLALVADVDEDLVVVDPDDPAGDDITFIEVAQRGVVVGDDLTVDLDEEAVGTVHHACVGLVSVAMSRERVAQYPSRAMPIRATKRGAERTPLDRDVDVLICGASFAGLAVARELAGVRRAGPDRRPLRGRREADVGLRGAHRVAREPRPRRVDPADVRRGSSCTRRSGTSTWPLPWTFSTFDYRELCALLFEQARRRVRDRQGRRRARAARCTRSTPTAATCAPRSSSTRSAGGACSARATTSSRPRRSSRAAWRCTPTARAEELELWLDPKYVPEGYSWSFPARDEVRVGVGSFDPRFHVKDPTLELAADVGVARRGLPGQLDPAQAAQGDRRRRSSSPATAPATACRSPPRASAPRSTSAWPAAASCARWSRAAARASEALARYGAFSDAHAHAFLWLKRTQNLVEPAQHHAGHAARASARWPRAAARRGRSTTTCAIAPPQFALESAAASARTGSRARPRSPHRRGRRRRLAPRRAARRRAGRPGSPPRARRGAAPGCG